MFNTLKQNKESDNKVDPFEMPAQESERDLNRSQLKSYSKLINHPDYYNTGKIEVIDAIQDWKLDFIEGNVIKYVVRSRHKSSRVGDLKKARWYLDYLIRQLEGE
jgi:predicted 2-oxoglutarate/Fe(II)-dependent dioxygenase YbiX